MIKRRQEDSAFPLSRLFGRRVERSSSSQTGLASAPAPVVRLLRLLLVGAVHRVRTDHHHQTAVVVGAGVVPLLLLAVQQEVLLLATSRLAKIWRQ